MALTIFNKNWDQLNDSQKIEYCENLFDHSLQARRQREMEWYLNYMFSEGYHYVYYNTVTRSIETPPREPKEVRVTVNKIKEIKRALQNYSLRFKPKWEVLPGDTDISTIDNARRSGKLLDYLDNELKLEIIRSACVESCLDTSVAWVELDWDDTAKKGLGEVKIMMHDAFDIYPDPFSSIDAGIVKGRFIAKAVVVSLDNIRNDKRYNKNRLTVKEDSSLSSSSVKSRIIRKEQGSLEDSPIKKAVVKEFYLYDEEENEKKGNLRLFTYSGKNVLRDEPLSDTEFPIYCMQVPQDPRKIYHRAWLSDLIVLNKALNRIISQKIMYVNQALIYRIITEKGSGPTTSSNESGEIIEINRGRVFKQMEMHPLPSTIDSLEADLVSHLENLSGVHQATIGRLPTGARSGDMLEALQAGDATNLSGLRSSLESFMSLLGSRILNIIADKYITSRIAKITGNEETDNPYMKYIGSASSNVPEGALVINKDNEVIVTMGSWLGYTPEAQRETIRWMAESGIIPADEVLRQFEFPNVRDLSEKARRQRLEQHVLQAEVAGRNQSQAPNMNTGQTEGGTINMADQENTAMINGQDLPPTPNADMNHTQTHLSFMRSDIYRQAGKTVQQIIANHTQGELQAQGVGR